MPNRSLRDSPDGGPTDRGLPVDTFIGSTTVAAIQAIPVRVPRNRRFLPKTAHGEVLYSEYVVVLLETTGGLTGLGEITCSPTWNGEEAGGTARLIEDEVAPLLTGVEASRWSVIAQRLDHLLNDKHPFLRAGIEMACLDVTARLLDINATVLLGGAARTTIPTKLVLPARDPLLVAELAEEALALGARSLKVKVGLDPAEDLRRVAAVREAAGAGTPILVDANEGWDVDAASMVIPRLMEFGVDIFEQPIAREELEAAARLRKMTNAHFVADESVWTWADLIRVADLEAFDVVSLYPGKCGGIRRFLAMSATADALGLDVTVGSNLELGIGAAAMATAAAAVPALSTSVPSDVIGPLYFEHALVADAGFVAWSGARLPEGSGLGIQLDRERLRVSAINDSSFYSA